MKNKIIEQTEEKYIYKVDRSQNTFIQVGKAEINKPSLNVSFADLLKKKAKS